MNGILRLFLNICILVIVYALVVSLTDKSKSGKYVKAVMSVIFVLVISGFISGFNFESVELPGFSSYKVDYSQVWDNTLSHMEEQLETQMYKLAESSGLDIDSVDVKLKTDYESFAVKSVEINGIDAISAKNLFAGYFNIGIAYININGA